MKNHFHCLAKLNGMTAVYADLSDILIGSVPHAAFRSPSLCCILQYFLFFLLPLCPARDLGLFGRGGQALKHSLLSQHVLNRAELGGI